MYVGLWRTGVVFGGRCLSIVHHFNFPPTTTDHHLELLGPRDDNKQHLLAISSKDLDRYIHTFHQERVSILLLVKFLFRLPAFLALHQKINCLTTSTTLSFQINHNTRFLETWTKPIVIMLQYDNSAFYFFAMSILSFYLLPCKYMRRSCLAHPKTVWNMHDFGPRFPTDTDLVYSPAFS